MGWVYLLLAGVCEIGWPIGLKIAQQGQRNSWLWIILAIISITVSGYLLFEAQKTISMGTAYAVWTGIGAVGAFICGILFFKDPASLYRILLVMLIVVGIVGLKLASN